eukprot:SAG31_NODE_43055_length_268_cov_6.295858_1_plen_45_part_00
MILTGCPCVLVGFTSTVHGVHARAAYARTVSIREKETQVPDLIY